LHITTIHRSGFLPAPITMTLNDLECPIHLKVRFTDGTLDVRTLWLSYSTIRTGITRGGRRGNMLEGQPPTLHPCGQLTRCFSAVAELLCKLFVENCVLFLPLSHSVPSLPMFPLEFCCNVSQKETRVMGLSYTEDRMIVIRVLLT